MVENGESCEFFQDVLNFEKHYKFNLTLLKIKEEEIQRIGALNKVLQNTINSYLDEISILKTKVHNLEELIRSSQDERSHQSLRCEEVVRKLTQKINALKTCHQENIKELENKMRRRCTELETSHRKTLNENGRQYSEKLSELQSNLQNEITRGAKLNKQMEHLIKVNLALHNQNREIESHYVPELSIHKCEIKTIKTINAEMKSKLESLELDYEFLKKQLLSNEDLNNKLKFECNAKNLELNKIYAEKNDMETKLKQKLLLCAQMNKELADHCEALESRNKLLENKHAHFISNPLLGEAKCGMNGGENLNRILQQNNVLRQIVKTYHNVNNDGNKHKTDQLTHKRLGQLEGLLMQLKEVTFEHLKLHEVN